jgi:uncharacterized membrane protein
MTGRRVSDRRHAFLPYLALVTLALIWGVSFLFIKVAVHDMSPAALVLIWASSGCLPLALIVRAMGRPLFAEGWRTRIITFAILTEDEIGIGARVAWTRLHVALEPTGALPLGAYLSGKLPASRAGLILSGGNANLETMAKLLGTP